MPVVAAEIRTKWIFLLSSVLSCWFLSSFRCLPFFCYLVFSLFPSTEYQGLYASFLRQIGFFEEDHILSPDSYQVLKVLCAMKSQGHVSSSVVTLASPNTDPTVSEYDFVAHAVDLDNLVINAGYAFNRSVWTSFKAHPEPFSRRHNWDAALADVLKLDPSLGPLQITSWLSRVRNIGEVGIHTDQVRCQSINTVVVCARECVCCALVDVFVGTGLVL